MKDRALVEIALREAAVPQDKLDTALAAQREMEKFKISKPLSSLLVEKGIAPRDRVAALLEVVSSCTVRCPGCGRTTPMKEADRNGILKCKSCSEGIEYPDGRIAEESLSPGARAPAARKREAKAAAPSPRKEASPAATGATTSPAARVGPREAELAEEPGSPREITRFEIGPLLGVSPCGKLYTVKQGRELHCLKVLDRALCADKTQYHKWVEHVQRLADLPRNITAHGGQLHKEGSTTYTVRPFLGDEDASLAARVTALGASPGLAMVFSLSEKLLESLAAFHAMHQTHGNIKPQNVIFMNESATLVDSGLYLLLAGLPREERAARLLDAARYLAPEVLSGSEPTPAADVFAAGRCIEDLLIAAGGAERARTLAGTVARMTSLDPSERLPTAREALRDLRTDKPEAKSSGSRARRKASSRGSGRYRWLSRVPLEKAGAAALCLVGAFLGFQGYFWFGASRALRAESRNEQLERQVIEEQLERLHADTLASAQPVEMESAWRELEGLLAGSKWEEPARRRHEEARRAAPAGPEAQGAASIAAARTALQSGDARRAIRQLLGLPANLLEAPESAELLRLATRKLQEEEGLVLVPAETGPGGKAFLVEASLARAGTPAKARPPAEPGPAAASQPPLVNINCSEAARIGSSRARRLLRASEWDRALALASGEGPSWAREGGETLKASLAGKHFEWVELDAPDALHKSGYGLCKGGDRPGVPRSHGARRKKDLGYPDVGVRFAEDL